MRKLTEQMNLRLDKDTKDILEQISENTGVSKSEIVREALYLYLNYGKEDRNGENKVYRGKLRWSSRMV